MLSLKKYLNPDHIKPFFLLIILTLCLSHHGISQDKDQVDFIKKGNLLLSFSLGYAGAERDNNFNQEFEKSFKRFQYSSDLLYLINENLAIGPRLGYERTERELRDPSDPRFDDIITTSGLEYGLTSAYFIKLRNESNKSSPNLYVGGGVSWLRNGFKRESSNDGTNYNTEFGYILYTGLYIPLGDKINLNWRLERVAREREFIRGEIVNGTVVITDRQTKWPSTTSLSVGFTVKF